MSLVTLTWRTYWNHSFRLAENLRSFITPATRAICLPALTAQQGLLLLGAALHLGLDLYLDEKRVFDSSDDPALLQCPLALLPAEEPSASGLALIDADDVCAEILRRLKDRMFIFSTSGSTGAAKPIKKSAEGLLREVDLLAELYALGQSATIVSWVRPFHIYGFLHAFLLPLWARSRVIYWNLSAGPALPSIESGWPEAVDLLITVPAHWSILTYLWSFSKVPTLVSSGAPFGRARREDLKVHRSGFDRYFEILGSTETGGIGYRRLDNDADHFRLFAGIRLEPQEGGTLIHSPFLLPDSSVFSADRLECIDAEHFRHLGRSDRVFKYGGRRFTLAEIEATLSSSCGGATVVCDFEIDAERAQGGILRAWVECQELNAASIAELRRRFLVQGPRPFPQSVLFLDRLPRDTQGKIAMTALRSSLQK